MHRDVPAQVQRVVRIPSRALACSRSDPVSVIQGFGASFAFIRRIILFHELRSSVHSRFSHI